MKLFGGFLLGLFILGMLAHAPGRRPYLKAVFLFGFLPFAAMWMLALAHVSAGFTLLVALVGGLLMLRGGFLLLGGATMLSAWMIWMAILNVYPDLVGQAPLAPPPEAPVGILDHKSNLTCHGVAIGETTDQVERRLGAGRPLSADRLVVDGFPIREYPGGLKVLYSPKGQVLIAQGTHLELDGKIFVQPGATAPAGEVHKHVRFDSVHGRVTRCYLVWEGYKPGLIEPGAQPFQLDGVTLEQPRAELENVWGQPVGQVGEVVHYPGGRAAIFRKGRVAALKGLKLVAGGTTLAEDAESGRNVIGSAYNQQALCHLTSQGRYFLLYLPHQQLRHVFTAAPP